MKKELKISDLKENHIRLKKVFAKVKKMKKTGICPRCKNNQIKGPYNAGHTLPRDHNCPLTLTIPFMHTATLETFTCANCGYTEYYVNEKGLKNLKSKGKPYVP